MYWPVHVIHNFISLELYRHGTCQNDKQVQHKDFSLEEAKGFFEKQMQQSFAYTRSSNGEKSKRLVAPSHWERIPITQAQSFANQEHFVVAGWVNPTGGSGHVVVIVPGTEQYSAYWGYTVPNSMDTEHNMRSDSQKLSASFGKDNIEFYKYK